MCNFKGDIPQSGGIISFKCFYPAILLNKTQTGQYANPAFQYLISDLVQGLRLVPQETCWWNAKTTPLSLASSGLLTCELNKDDIWNTDTFPPTYLATCSVPGYYLSGRVRLCTQTQHDMSLTATRTLHLSNHRKFFHRSNIQFPANKEALITISLSRRDAPQHSQY